MQPQSALAEFRSFSPLHRLFWALATVAVLGGLFLEVMDWTRKATSR